MWLESEILEKWSIGIRKMIIDDGSLKITDQQKALDPVLTSKDIRGEKAIFVADPFLVLSNGTYYMFFEVFKNNRGCIGLAESCDGLNWKYAKIVLEEPFHLSYPFIFSWEGRYYMLPESRKAGSVRLYQAVNFPDEWHFVKTLIEGNKFVDPTIFHYNKLFWLFVADTSNSNLYLYYSDTLNGVWEQHPVSPVIKNDRGSARPGGPVIMVGQRLIRVAQDDQKTYGQAVRAFEITRLDTQNYEEKELQESPLLQASGTGWNKDGMHHLSVCQVGAAEWLAAVDGKINYKRYKLCAFVPDFAGRLFQKYWRV